MTPATFIRDLKRDMREWNLRRTRPELYDDRVQLPRLMALSEWGEGRSVAIVGNAESLFAARGGEAIDSHDLVLRINRGFITRPESQGTRTDLVCLATKIAPEEARREFGNATIVLASPYRSNTSSGMLHPTNNPLCYPFTAWRELCVQVDEKPPSAGLIAVDIARRFMKARSVSLFGFDWKATKTFYRRELRRGIHDWPAERRHIEKWAMEGWLHLPPQIATEAP